MPLGQVRRACAKAFGGRGHGREMGETKACGAGAEAKCPHRRRAQGPDRADLRGVCVKRSDLYFQDHCTVRNGLEDNQSGSV